jgi:hypothetical protein
VLEAAVDGSDVSRKVAWRSLIVVTVVLVAALVATWRVFVGVRDRLPRTTDLP